MKNEYIRKLWKEFTDNNTELFNMPSSTVITDNIINNFLDE